MTPRKGLLGNCAPRPLTLHRCSPSSADSLYNVSWSYFGCEPLSVPLDRIANGTYQLRRLSFGIVNTPVVVYTWNTGNIAAHRDDAVGAFEHLIRQQFRTPLIYRCRLPPSRRRRPDPACPLQSCLRTRPRRHHRRNGAGMPPPFDYARCCACTRTG